MMAVIQPPSVNFENRTTPSVIAVASAPRRLIERRTQGTVLELLHQ